jgi:prepilin peptidase CpaA
MLHLAALIVFPALMAWAAVSDLLTMTIPNRLSLGLAAAFLLFAVLGGMAWSDLLSHLGAGAMMLALCFALFALGWVGGGDAKLCAATSLWLGFDALMPYGLYASIAGGGLTLLILSARGVPLPAFALGWSWLERLHDEKTGIPYGIALALAGLIVYPESQLWKLLATH